MAARGPEFPVSRSGTLDSTIVGAVAFLCTFGGALVGMTLRKLLPQHHLDADSKDTIKVCIGFIATMTALVLGLVTASAKNSFDGMDAGVKQTAVELLTLDRTLARYGPETAPIRQTLKEVVGSRLQVIWPTDRRAPADVDPAKSAIGAAGERLEDSIRALQPGNDLQRALQTRSLDLTETLLQTRWLVLGGVEHSIPMPFLAIILFWLTIIFASFGLFAPRNAMVIAVLFVCTLSVSSALFLILEMDAPFKGMLRVSPDLLQYAYAHLGQ
jgi:hypothetical protein